MLKNDEQKKFYLVKCTCIYEHDGCPYEEDVFYEETMATTKEKAENNVRWRVLRNHHIGGMVDHLPYSDKYSEQWIFEAENINTKIIDKRKENNNEKN